MLQAPGNNPCVTLVAPCAGLVGSSPDVCSSGDWCWKNPAPQGDSLNDVWAVNDTDAFAVGPPDQVLHWHGGTWGYKPSGTSNVLFAVWASSVTDAWAVGEAGTIVHWDGTHWTLAHQGGATLRALSGTGPQDVWAGGDGGTLLHWDGTGWSVASSETTFKILAMWAGAPHNLWLSTLDEDGLGNVIQRWNGQAWTQVPSTGRWVQSFWGFGPDDVWGVGTQGLIAHWNGNDWTYMPTFSRDYYYRKVWGRSPTELWLAGPRLWKFDGTSLSMQSYEDFTSKFIVSVAGGPSGPLLAVGFSGLFLQHASGEQWDVQGPLPTDIVDSIDDIWARTSNDAWATSAGKLLHWDGVSWTQVQDDPSMRLHAVTGSSPNHVWVIGESLVVGGVRHLLRHFDGTQWTELYPPTTDSLTQVWALQEDSVWVVTSGGGILQWNGQAWSQFSTNKKPLFSIHGSGADNVWAVGARGAVFQWNGQQWVDRSLGSVDFTAVWVYGPEDVWMTATDGSVAHWNGQVLQRMTTATLLRLNALSGRAPNDLWAVGDGGVIVHWDGAQWAAVSSGTRSQLLSLGGADGSLFAGGVHGVLLHRQ